MATVRVALQLPPWPGRRRPLPRPRLKPDATRRRTAHRPRHALALLLARSYEGFPFRCPTGGGRCGSSPSSLTPPLPAILAELGEADGTTRDRARPWFASVGEAAGAESVDASVAWGAFALADGFDQRIAW